MTLPRLILFFSIILLVLSGILVLARPLFVSIGATEVVSFLTGVPVLAAVFYTFGGGMLFGIYLLPRRETIGTILVIFGVASWLLGSFMTFAGISVNFGFMPGGGFFYGITKLPVSASTVFMRGITTIVMGLVGLFSLFSGLRQWALVIGGIATIVFAFMNFLSVGLNIAPIVQVLVGIGFVSLGIETARLQAVPEY